jgi:hypothetical protein
MPDKYDEIFNPDIFKRLDINQDEENQKIQEQIEKEKKDNDK